MQSFAITNKGTEEVCALEISELINCRAQIGDRMVTFKAGKYEDLCKLVYLGQSMSKIVLELGEFSFKDDFYERMATSILKSDISRWLHQGVTFKAECIRFGSHFFSSIDVEKSAGESILKAAPSAKVDLKDPTIKILFFINEGSCHFGVDFAGIDLSSRDYKIFSHRESLNSTIAYSLVRFSGWGKKGNLLDPFCGSGTIPIEATIYQSGFPVNHYRKEKLAFRNIDLEFDQAGLFERLDKSAKLPVEPCVYGSDYLLPNVNASVKNAKIAGVEKAVEFSRADIDWLDTKFDEDSVSFVVTDMPRFSSQSRAGAAEKLYKDFFYQIDFIMKKKNAVMVVLCAMPEMLKSSSAGYGFDIAKQFEIWQGKEKMSVLKLVR